MLRPPAIEERPLDPALELRRATDLEAWGDAAYLVMRPLSDRSVRIEVRRVVTGQLHDDPLPFGVVAKLRIGTDPSLLAAWIDYERTHFECLAQNLLCVSRPHASVEMAAHYAQQCRMWTFVLAESLVYAYRVGQVQALWSSNRVGRQP